MYHVEFLEIILFKKGLDTIFKKILSYCHVSIFKKYVSVLESHYAKVPYRNKEDSSGKLKGYSAKFVNEMKLSKCTNIPLKVGLL